MNFVHTSYFKSSITFAKRVKIFDSGGITTQGASISLYFQLRLYYYYPISNQNIKITYICRIRFKNTQLDNSVSMTLKKWPPNSILTTS